MQFYTSEKMKNFRNWAIITGILWFIFIGFILQFVLIYKACTLPKHEDRWIFILGSILGLFFLGWVIDFIMAIIAWIKAEK